MNYLGRRLIRTILLLIGVSALCFLFTEMAPGSFFDEMRLNPQISPETIATLRSRYGLDQPLIVRYGRWVKSALHADLGYSIAYNVPVAPLLWGRAQNTLLLSATAMFLTWLISVPLGVWTAARRGRVLDKTTNLAGSLLVSIPEIVIAVALHVVPLEFRALIDRVFQSFNYDAAIMGLGGGDADPNPEMNVWMSNGTSHLWNLGETQPATAWEREIDQLMQQQMAEHPAIEWKEVITALTDRVREKVHVDTHLAERLADIAIGVAETIDDQISVAKSLRAKANALYALDQHAAATPAFLLILWVSLWQAGLKAIFLPLAKIRGNPRIAQSRVEIIDMLLFVFFLALQMLYPEKRIRVP